MSNGYVWMRGNSATKHATPPLGPARALCLPRLKLSGPAGPWTLAWTCPRCEKIISARTGTTRAEWSKEAPAVVRETSAQPKKVITDERRARIARREEQAGAILAAKNAVMDLAVIGSDESQPADLRKIANTVVRYVDYLQSREQIAWTGLAQVRGDITRAVNMCDNSLNFYGEVTL